MGLERTRQWRIQDFWKGVSDLVLRAKFFEATPISIVFEPRAVADSGVHRPFGLLHDVRLNRTSLSGYRTKKTAALEEILSKTD